MQVIFINTAIIIFKFIFSFKKTTDKIVPRIKYVQENETAITWNSFRKRPETEGMVWRMERSQQSRTEAHLLVVDDEPNIRDLLASSLRFAGFEVSIAGDGNGALKTVEKASPDLVVSGRVVVTITASLNFLYFYLQLNLRPVFRRSTRKVPKIHFS